MVERSINAQIRDYINQNILFEDETIKYGDDDSLLETGILDSFAIMDLIFFVEQHLGIEIEDHDITPDNFDSVNKLASFIQSQNGA